MRARVEKVDVLGWNKSYKYVDFNSDIGMCTTEIQEKKMKIKDY